MEYMQKCGGDIVAAKDALVAHFGEGYLVPFTEEEISLKAKADCMGEFIRGRRCSDEFTSFYYNNDLEERAMGIAKGKMQKSVVKPAASEKQRAYERSFPELLPEKKMDGGHALVTNSYGIGIVA